MADEFPEVDQFADLPEPVPGEDAARRTPLPRPRGGEGLAQRGGLADWRLGAPPLTVAPHRGPLLWWLTQVSPVCALLTLLSLGGAVWQDDRTLAVLALPCCAAGLALGIASRRLAGLDLDRMRRGEVDEAGLQPTLAARKRGLESLALNAAAGLFCVGLLAYWLW